MISTSKCLLLLASCSYCRLSFQLLLPPVAHVRAAHEMLSSPRRSPLPFRAAAPADTFTPRVLPTLLRTPVLTLRLVSEVVSDQLWHLSAWLRTHGTTAACTLFGLALLRAVACQFDGSAGLVHGVERFVAFSIWWLSLGVLSSIGLGSGVHTGMLFLFPHIAKVCHSAEQCGHLRFDSWTNAWFAVGAGELFACEGGSGQGGSPTLGALVGKTILPSLLWGIGTALGEVPPFLIARASAAAGKSNAELAGLDVQQPSSGLFERAKAWMVHVLQRHGFWALVALASCPNAAFDLCGICCGHFGMPFAMFLGGTLLGKGFIKASWQCVFLTIVFTSSTREILVERVGGVLEAVSGSGRAKSLLRDALAAVTSSNRGHGPKSSLLASLWAGLLLCVGGFFVVTCLEQVALGRALELEARQKNKGPGPLTRGRSKLRVD